MKFLVFENVENFKNPQLKLQCLIPHNYFYIRIEFEESLDLEILLDLESEIHNNT